MIGPTGVGKTEIARRLAKLVDAPFVKVEATKFTEVGYVGRDVESIIRDLLEASIRLVKEQHSQRVHDHAEANVENRLVELLTNAPKKKPTNPSTSCSATGRRSRNSAPRTATSSPCARTTCARACAAAKWSTRWSKSRSKRSRRAPTSPAPT